MNETNYSITVVILLSAHLALIGLFAYLFINWTNTPPIDELHTKKFQ